MTSLEQQGILLLARMDSLLQGKLVAIEAVAYAALATLVLIEPSRAALVKEVLRGQLDAARQQFLQDNDAASKSFAAAEAAAFAVIDAAERRGKELGLQDHDEELD